MGTIKFKIGESAHVLAQKVARAEGVSVSRLALVAFLSSLGQEPPLEKSSPMSKAGYEVGHEAGYDEGYEAGHHDGYESGFEAGYKEGSDNLE